MSKYLVDDCPHICAFGINQSSLIACSVNAITPPQSGIPVTQISLNLLVDMTTALGGSALGEEQA